MLFQSDLGVSEPRMQDLKSLQSGEHSRYLQARSGVPGARFKVMHWDMNRLNLYFVCPQPAPVAVVAGQSKIFRTCPNVWC